jgi:hypothetical protein
MGCVTNIVVRNEKIEKLGLVGVNSSNKGVGGCVWGHMRMFVCVMEFCKMSKSIEMKIEFLLTREKVNLSDYYI